MRVRNTGARNLDGMIKLIREQVERGLADGEARQLAVRIVSGKFEQTRNRNGDPVETVRGWGKNYLAPPGEVCKSRDAECEVEKIWDFLVLNCRYVYDTLDRDVYATLKESLDAGGGDCFPAGTQLLRDDGSLCPVEQLQAGMKIWGRDRWSEVTDVWANGDLPLTAIRLNNGSLLRLTEDHKVYVGVCHRHAGRGESKGCSCPISDREIMRIPVSELKTAAEQPNMILLQPERISWSEAAPTGDAVDWAALKGYYLADGWLKRKGDGAVGVCIAGKDGHPKEAQKELLESIAARLGINTGWQDRWITLWGKEIGTAFARLGSPAPNKVIDEIPKTLAEVRALLDGLLADSGKNTHGPGYTFTTTSRELAVQTRVLHRMLGISCGYAYLENHGGLGTHPIHRLTARMGSKQKLLRVKEITRGLPAEHVWDITTDDHYVYLPEHDVTVSNCDDGDIAFATLLGHLGFHVKARVISELGAPEEPVHTYPLVGLPKDNPTKWVPLDMTVPGALPGWEYPDRAKVWDFDLVG